MRLTAGAALPLVILVLANAEYAILKSFGAQEKSPNVPGLDLPGLHTARLAEGYGVTGVVARSAVEVRRALDEAADRTGPTLIEVPVDPTVPPLL